MALTSSNEMALGTQAPDFKLRNTVHDTIQGLDELKGEKGTVILFICNHCPFVIHVNETLVKLALAYQAKGINFIAISSNDVETHPQDGPSFMKAHALQHNYPFPYLYDESQSVAKAYAAACTPDIYLFDKDLKLTYHGQLDDSRPGNNIPSTGQDLAKAMDYLLDGKGPMENQKASIGCNIKWR